MQEITEEKNFLFLNTPSVEVKLQELPRQVGAAPVQVPEVLPPPVHVLTLSPLDSPKPVLQLYVAVTMNPRERLGPSE